MSKGLLIAGIALLAPLPAAHAASVSYDGSAKRVTVIAGNGGERIELVCREFDPEPAFDEPEFAFVRVNGVETPLWVYCSEIRSLRITGNGGDDEFGANRISGGNGGFPSLVGARFDGGAGNDRISAIRTSAVLGGPGDDTISGNGGSTLAGGDGADNIFGGPDRERIFGGKGGDEIAGSIGDDLLYGGPGSDLILGEGLPGQEGDDTIRGGGGRDRLYGDGGGDLIYGGSRADILFGGPGGDRLQGGRGRDLCSQGVAASVHC